MWYEGPVERRRDVVSGRENDQTDEVGREELLETKGARSNATVVAGRGVFVRKGGFRKNRLYVCEWVGIRSNLSEGVPARARAGASENAYPPKP